VSQEIGKFKIKGSFKGRKRVKIRGFITHMGAVDIGVGGDGLWAQWE